LFKEFSSNKFFFYKRSDKKLTKLLEESEMFENVRKKDPVQYQNDIKNAVKKLQNIIQFNNRNESEKLINVFRLDSEESGQDIELTILRAFLNGIIILILIFLT
jgi:hypothetical protein